MAGFNVTDPDAAPRPGTGLAGGLAGWKQKPESGLGLPGREKRTSASPCLRGLTPEQQSAYGRYLLARLGPPSAAIEADDTKSASAGARGA